VNPQPLSSDPGNHHPTALEDCPDPVSGLLAAYRAGSLISVRSSGSTGRPRRVIRTAASWVDSFPIVAQLIALQPGSRAWIPGPLTATMNLYAAALVRFSGARMVAEVGNATHAFLTPTGLIDLLAQAGPTDLRTVVAGDRLRPELADCAEQRGWHVSHYYGATQLSFVAWGRDAASLRPFPEVDIEVRRGELWVNSPWLCEREVVAPGTAPSMAVELDPHTGCRWASVADHGELAADGRVIIAGRTDAILVGGATVLISEVEAALRDAASGEVYVVASPHARLGSVVTAVYTNPADLHRLQHHARTVLDRHRRPVRWVHLAALPATAAGKVDRGALAVLVRRR
jgi:long-chain acyl-CoA synthetase